MKRNANYSLLKIALQSLALLITNISQLNTLCFQNYIPQKIADRLREYIQDKGIGPEKRIFPITYNAARVMVKKAGELAGVNLRPHDLRRNAGFTERSDALSYLFKELQVI